MCGAVSVYRCYCLYFLNAIERPCTEVPETSVGHLVQSYCVHKSVMHGQKKH